MPKSRFALLDVIAAKQQLLECVGYRVNNIYDINDKTYAFKLHQTGQQKDKKLLLMESGIRFHLTSFTRDKSDNPSPFTMKLRKHLRGKRLVNVQQLGMDRVVSFDFGSGEAAYHLILELYDKGNIVLCDYQYAILGLLRSHTYNEETKVAKKQIYPLFNDAVVRGQQQRKESAEVEKEQVAQETQETQETQDAHAPPQEPTQKPIQEPTHEPAQEPTQTDTIDVETHVAETWDVERLLTWITKATTTASDHARQKKKKNKPLTLKAILSKRGSPYDADRYGPDVVEHCLYTVQEQLQLQHQPDDGGEEGGAITTNVFNPQMKLSGVRGTDWNLSVNACNLILQTLQQEPSTVVAQLLPNENNGATTASEGYILYQTMEEKNEKKTTATTATATATATTTATTTATPNKTTTTIKLYCEFSPLLLKQHTSSTSSYEIMKCTSFDTAVDEYYAKIETQKAQKRHQTATANVHSKLNKMKLLQKERVDALENEVAMYETHAIAIEAHIENVQNSILVVNR